MAKERHKIKELRELRELRGLLGWKRTRSQISDIAVEAEADNAICESRRRLRATWVDVRWDDLLAGKPWDWIACPGDSEAEYSSMEGGFETECQALIAAHREIDK